MKNINRTLTLYYSAQLFLQSIQVLINKNNRRRESEVIV